MAGIFKSVADMFRPTQQVSMAQQNTTAGTAPAPGTSAPVTPTPPANGLDQFATLWQTDPNAKPSVDPFATPLLNTDPAKIAQAASKMDFVGHVAPDMLAKAMSGQDPQAFMDVLNSVAQRTLTTSAQISATTVEQATARNNERIQQALPARVTQIQLDGMVPENPALQHPASAPFLQLVRSQIRMKNPGMSAAEISRQAEQTVLNYAQELAVAPVIQQQQREQAAGTDWDSWVGN